MEQQVSSVKWLRELGAVRPMAPAGHEVLVLGECRDGYYPIEWRLYYDTWSRDVTGALMNRQPIEAWKIFGIPCHALTREDCVRILERCK